MKKTEETIRNYIGNKYLIKLPMSDKCYSKEEANRLAKECQKEAEMQALYTYMMHKIHTGIRTGSNCVEINARNCPYRCYRDKDDTLFVPFSEESFEVIRLRELGYKVTICNEDFWSSLIVEW